ncbi:hypothetical protein RCL1_000052 [Eukaryota sp. TZLM3-RCL]
MSDLPPEVLKLIQDTSFLTCNSSSPPPAPKLSQLSSIVQQHVSSISSTFAPEIITTLSSPLPDYSLVHEELSSYFSVINDPLTDFHIAKTKSSADIRDLVSTAESLSTVHLFSLLATSLNDFISSFHSSNFVLTAASAIKVCSTMDLVTRFSIELPSELSLHVEQFYSNLDDFVKLLQSNLIKSVVGGQKSLLRSCLVAINSVDIVIDDFQSKTISTLINSLIDSILAPLSSITLSSFVEKLKQGQFSTAITTSINQVLFFGSILHANEFSCRNLLKWSSFCTKFWTEFLSKLSSLLLSIKINGITCTFGLLYNILSSFKSIHDSITTTINHYSDQSIIFDPIELFSVDSFLSSVDNLPIFSSINQSFSTQLSLSLQSEMNAFVVSELKSIALIFKNFNPKFGQDIASILLSFSLDLKELLSVSGSPAQKFHQIIVKIFENMTVVRNFELFRAFFDNLIDCFVSATPKYSEFFEIFSLNFKRIVDCSDEVVDILSKELLILIGLVNSTPNNEFSTQVARHFLSKVLITILNDYQFLLPHYTNLVPIFESFISKIESRFLVSEILELKFLCSLRGQKIENLASIICRNSEILASSNVKNRTFMTVVHVFAINFDCLSSFEDNARLFDQFLLDNSNVDVSFSIFLIALRKI